MSLYLNNTIDPIAAVGGRELSYVPRHFTRIRINPNSKHQQAKNWIWKNLTGRFSIRQRGYYAFESPAEATMFSLIASNFVNE